MERSFHTWIGQAILFTLFTCGIFLLLRWMDVQIGTVTLWVSGVAVYWVLSGITILPWNIYFVADEALAEIARTEDKGGQCNARDKEYARKARRKAGIMAVCVHVVTALIFLLLAFFTDLGSICYLAAGAALGLTVLRPAVRSVEFVLSRLQNIRSNAHFPRDDVYEIKERLQKIEHFDKTAEDLEKKFAETSDGLREAYDEKYRVLQAYCDKNNGRMRELEQMLLHIHREISDKIDTFDDAVAFKAAWGRIAAELANIFHGPK